MSGKRPTVGSQPPRARRIAKASVSAEELFQRPGSPQTLRTKLRTLAAAAHGRLFDAAAASLPSPDDRSLRCLSRLISSQCGVTARRSLFLDPVFIRYLHALAPISKEIRGWHDQTAASCPAGSNESSAKREALAGNLILPLRLQGEPAWRGRLRLQTDAFGRLGFPRCDWRIVLRSASDPAVFAHHPVVVSAERNQFRWYRAEADATPFLVTTRSAALRMLANCDRLDAGTLRSADHAVQPTLRRSACLGDSRVCYDPIAFTDPQHAAVTGRLVEIVLAALECNSPVIRREFCRYISVVRGFEAPLSSDGFVQSFSDPREPGVVSVNVAYTSEGYPRFDPYWFTCFGHELAHNKCYLIDSVAFDADQKLARNLSDWTTPLPRYGRPLRIRTLLQIPYTHLYEWGLLMAFLRSGFRGLPWSLPGSPVGFGDDLQHEVDEAFQLIDDYVDLTPFGRSVMKLLRQQFQAMRSAWRAVPG